MTQELLSQLDGRPGSTLRDGTGASHILKMGIGSETHRNTYDIFSFFW